MPLLGKGAIAIWNDIAAAHRTDFHEWHPREHMPERLAIPGFRRGRRYASTSADIEFFTLYEIETESVAVGKGYRDRLDNPTPWSVEMVRHFRANLRGVCRVGFSCGYADGAHMGTIRLEGTGDRQPMLAEIADRLTCELEQPRICGVHLLMTDPQLSKSRANLHANRSISLPDWVILIEGATAEAVAASCERLSADARCTPVAGLYALEYGVTAQTND